MTKLFILCFDLRLVTGRHLFSPAAADPGGFGELIYPACRQ